MKNITFYARKYLDEMDIGVKTAVRRKIYRSTILLNEVISATIHRTTSLHCVLSVIGVDMPHWKETPDDPGWRVFVPRLRFTA